MQICPAVLLFASLLFQQADAERPEVLVGVAPVHDQTGGIFHEVYGVNLRRLLVREMLKLDVAPIFLNAGPAFDPAEGDLIQELAEEAQVTHLLQVRLVGVVDGFHANRLQEAQKRANGQESAGGTPQFSPQNVRNEDLQRLIDLGAAHLLVETSLAPLSSLDTQQSFFTAVAIRRNFFKDLARITPDGSSTASHRKFTDTATGRAAAKSASRIAKRLKKDFGLSRASQAESAVGTSNLCEVSFGVRFLSSERTSRSYTVAINGKEASYRIRNGRVKLEVPSGHFQASVSVLDTPYGLRTQDVYDANTFLQCPDGEVILFLEIGNLGEAFLKRAS